MTFTFKFEKGTASSHGFLKGRPYCYYCNSMDLESVNKRLYNRVLF